MKKALLQLHTAIFLAGFTAILGKLISLSEAPLVWWRLLITVLALAVFVRFQKGIPTKYANALILKVLGVGALVGLHWLCFFASVKFANVSIALVCFSASGFFSSVLEPTLFSRKYSLFEMLLGFISMLGIYIIFQFDSRYKVGIAFGVAAAFLSALFSVFNKRLVHQMHGIQMTRYEMLGAFVMLSAVLPFYTIWGDAAFWPTAWDWVWLLILSLACTVWAFALQLNALHHISAFTLNLSYNLEPVYGIILAFLFFGENKHLHPSFYIGALLIVATIFIKMMAVKKKRLSDTKKMAV
jgi:drug/metabolite transporter (DMT)-like permease